MCPNFQTFDTKSKKVGGIKEFLEIATSEEAIVVLKGSGDIGGFVVTDASLEYDLSIVGNLTKYWDQRRNGSCHSCYNHYYDLSTGDSEHACKKLPRNDWSGNCPKYDAYKKNVGGKPARKLAELIEEASGESKSEAYCRHIERMVNLSR